MVPAAPRGSVTFCPGILRLKVALQGGTWEVSTSPLSHALPGLPLARPNQKSGGLGAYDASSMLASLQGREQGEGGECISEAKEGAQPALPLVCICLNISGWGACGLPEQQIPLLGSPNYQRILPLSKRKSASL